MIGEGDRPIVIWAASRAKIHDELAGGKPFDETMHTVRATNHAND